MIIMHIQKKGEKGNGKRKNKKKGKGKNRKENMNEKKVGVTYRQTDTTMVRSK